jgi:transposase
MEITTIGLDLAKNVFQVHAINGASNVVVKKTLRRSQMRGFFERIEPCLVGIEACGTSHYWAREITRLGHDVRLMPPAYVKPYVKRGKTDASDAEAICEAVMRPTMRYVAIKSPEQQAALALHRTRDLFVKQRTQLVNMIRGLLGEFGIEIRRGIGQALMLAKRITAGDVPDIPPLAAKVIAGLAGQVLDLQARLNEIERELLAWHRSNDIAKRLATIPGSDRCAPQRLRPLSPTRISSGPDGSSPPGWA